MDIKMTKIVRDGVPVEVNDDARIIIDALDAKLVKAAADAVKAQATFDTALAAADAAKAKAEAERDAAQGKVLDAAALDARVAARADLLATARAIHDTDYTGMTDAAIRKAAVTAKLGDAALKDKSDAYVDARFDILAEDAKADIGTRDVISKVLNTAPTGSYQATVDAARKAADDLNAWRNVN